jgi:hypothetical protein
MLKTAANPSGLPMDAFDGIRAGVLKPGFFFLVLIGTLRLRSGQAQKLEVVPLR